MALFTIHERAISAELNSIHVFSEAAGVVSIARIERPPLYREGSARTETIPVSSPSLSESARLIKNYDSLAEEGLDLLKEQRDGTVLCNLGDERFRVVFQEPRDAGECLDEDLSHFLAL